MRTNSPKDLAAVPGRRLLALLGLFVRHGIAAGVILFVALTGAHRYVYALAGEKVTTDSAALAEAELLALVFVKLGRPRTSQSNMRRSQS